MNVLHTAHSYPPEASGVSHVVSHISRRLAARGHSVTVFTGRPRNALSYETIDGVCVRRFNNSGSMVAGIRGDQRAYIDAVMSRKWDVIVMHCFQTWTTDLLLKRIDSIRAPSILVAHGAAYGNPAFDHYFRWVAGQVRKVSATVGLSARLEDSAFARDYRLPDPRIIPNGVDLEEWSAPTLGLRTRWRLARHPWVINVSNHNPNKGHEQLWKVADKIQRQDPGAVFTIIGGTYPAARLNLGSLGVIGGCWYKCLSRSVFQPRVRLSRDLPRGHVVSALKEADVYLLPSRWEAYPLSLLESMAAGTPWVSFDVGCVRDNEGGVVVRDSDEMATVTQELLRRPELRTPLIEAGIAQISSKHDWADIAMQYESLYAEVISRLSP